jgi:hypothetical protein
MDTKHSVEAKGKAVATKTLIQARVVAFVGVVFVLLWKATDVFLLVFAGILLAVFLHGKASALFWLPR